MHADGGRAGQVGAEAGDVGEAVAAVERQGGVLLVAGSSLAVMSGYRFVRRAAKAGIPVVIVNRGATRGDGEATYKLEVGTSEFLTTLAQSRFTGSGRA